MDLGRMLTQTAARASDKTAIIFNDQPTTYAELDRRANQVANALIARGVMPGDRVALYMQNLPLFMEAYFGILKAGAVVVPMNPQFKAGEIGYMLADSGAKALLTFGPLGQIALAAAANAPEVRDIIVATPQPMPGAVSWAEAFGGAPETTPGVEVHPEQVAVLIYTSGTTGRPKGAMLSHRNLISNCEQCMMVPAIAPRPDDVLWLALPLFHSYALSVGMNLSVLNGTTMALVDLASPLLGDDTLTRLVNALAVVQKHRCTLMLGAPPMFVAWSQIPAVKNIDLTSLRYIASGAAALPVKVMQGFETMTGAPISEGYGLSEASPVLSSNAAGPITKPGTVGPAIPGVEIKIVDELGNEVPQGQLGELIARGPNIMMGYWNNPEATADTLKDGWLHTGDLAVVDSDGYYSIVDRKKDLIIVSGENVYPREVEEVLFTHPAVAEAAVVGYPTDERQGEGVMAFVVLKQGQAATEQEIIDFCRERIATIKCPRRVVFRSELPKNNTGKVLRRELRAEAVQLVGGGA
ncbi:MAG TPA: long-chain fatty acid--CoA ligase [Ktedonobacterales bacterium]|nr:long-chain fatty acid--CoA ligase [Ktedonobacterales bacterium]